jgi:hypothetical protein
MVIPEARTILVEVRRGWQFMPDEFKAKAIAKIKKFTPVPGEDGEQIIKST